MSEMENAPAGNEGENRESTAADSHLTRDHGPLLNAAAGYCVLVESAHGRYRRRVYLSLNSAEKAVKRARDNGKYAALVLAVISPAEVIA